MRLFILMCLVSNLSLNVLSRKQNNRMLIVQVVKGQLTKDFKIVQVEVCISIWI